MTIGAASVTDSIWQSQWLPGGLAAIGLALVAMLLLAARAWSRRQRNTPQHLLKELCAAHRLRARQRRLIAKVAAELGLEQPALLFLEPALWDRARLGEIGRRHANELSALERQLFDGMAV